MKALILWLVGLTTVFAQTTNDAGLVRQVIENETRAYLDVKPDVMRASWADKPYIERQQDVLKALTGGAPYLKGEPLLRFGDTYMKTATNNHHQLRISDYDAHLSGDMAWATYTEEEVDPTGAVVRKNRNVRILERGATGWKMVFQGIKKL